MKWLRKLVLTETLAQQIVPGKTWFVCTKTGKDETGSGLSAARPTTFDAAMREATPNAEDIVYVLPTGKSSAIQSI